jgi:hypothetical protein
VSETTAATQVMVPRRRPIQLSRPMQIAGAALLGIAALAGGLAFGLTRGTDSPASPPAQSERLGEIPRGNTPAESARILADWLRARAAS